VKLQNAYIAEKGNLLGNWFEIGYSGPGDETKAKSGNGKSESTNFIYSEETGAANVEAKSSGFIGWKAANKAKLNSCAGDGTVFHWTMTVAEGDAAGEVTYTPALANDTDGECQVLTPNFTAIK
jgi:hypothetical protein